MATIGVILLIAGADDRARNLATNGRSTMPTQQQPVSAIRSERPRDEARTRLEIHEVDGSDERSCNGPSETEVL
jgi:hypothetical protein